MIFNHSRYALTCLLLSSYLSVASAQEPTDRKPLFGDLHMHTGYSLDAYIFGTRATPDDAYNFAKGQPLDHPLGPTYQMSRPLDFLGVTDHAVFMGVFAKMGDPSHPLSKHPFAKRVHDPDPDVALTVFRDLVSFRGNPGLALQVMQLSRPEITEDTWERTIAAANRHNDPGTFTALIGYEWTSAPDGQNLHRNIFFKGDTAPIPFSSRQSGDPEKLWDWMDKIRSDGFELLAIPHNSNMSDGRMFRRESEIGKPFDKAYADRRNLNEPLVEVTQVKGTSETHPALSPNDEFADFELVEFYVAVGKPVTKFKGGYVRDAYRTGLEMQDTDNFNPYQFGLVGATDSHTGIVSDKEETYSGKVGRSDGSPARRLGSPRVSRFSASGLTGVWAEENTRESIFAALRRKETWATTGPRIKVRFFGGFEFDDLQAEGTGWVDEAYRRGVSMGGTLTGQDAETTESPTFIVSALKDPENANLDRIQIIKVWSDEGVSNERIYDVVWSDDRTMDATTGKLQPVGNTVDLESVTYENSIGAVSLQAKWTDPDFVPAQNAVYYARVIEIPTPRWSTYDAKRLGVAVPDDLPKTIQERAYTSPIFYSHH